MQLSEKALTADPHKELLITAVTAALLVLLNYLQSEPGGRWAKLQTPAGSSDSGDTQGPFLMYVVNECLLFM